MGNHPTHGSPGTAAPESSRWDQLEKKENQLWRRALWLLLLLAVAWSGAAWEHLKSFPLPWGGVPVGLLVLMAVFAFYAHRKRMEIAELRSFMRGDLR